MPTLGNDPASFNTYVYSLSNTENVVVGPLVTMPAPGGSVTELGVYVNGYSGTVKAQGAIWTSTGSLVYATPQATAPQGNPSVGGQSWMTWSVTNLWLGAGSYYIGWWRAPGGSSIWSLTSGTYYTGATPGSNGAGNLPTMSSQSGDPGAYLVYSSTFYPHNQFVPYWIIRWNAHPHG